MLIPVIESVDGRTDTELKNSETPATWDTEFFDGNEIVCAFIVHVSLINGRS